jgi:thioredoxin reductase (NADPH)
MRDVIIIGAGPAGLTAATHLARLRRPPLVIDGGDSRARWITASHNIPGFLERDGAAFLKSLRAQAQHHGADIRRASVEYLFRQGSSFGVSLHGEICFSRFVLLATGIKDHLPLLPGASERELRKVLKVCPPCDGWEASGRSIAVIGRGTQGEHDALFLRGTYSGNVSYVHLGKVHDPTSRSRLVNAGVDYLSARLGDFTLENGELQLAQAERTITFEVCYAALGCTPQDEMAVKLGAARDGNRALLVDGAQQTSVDGLYAAGEVVRGTNQIAAAVAQAALAAEDIHRRLLLR